MLQLSYIREKHGHEVIERLAVKNFNGTPAETIQTILEKDEERRRKQNLLDGIF